jgi:hypothetical protein
MEGVIFHSSGMDNESTLGNAADFLLESLLVVVIIRIVTGCWEHWVWFAYDFKWLKLAVFTDGHESPVVETTFPELTKVKVNFLLNVIDGSDVSLLNFMPRQQMVVVAVDWRWGSKSQKDLRIFSLLLVSLDDNINYEMLTNTSNNRSECLL